MKVSRRAEGSEAPDWQGVPSASVYSSVELTTLVSAHRWVVDDLYPVAIWILEVQRTRAVAMGSRRAAERNAVALQVRGPSVDVPGRPHEEPEVVERRIASGTGRADAVESKVVRSRRQVAVVPIRLPLDLKPKHLDIETLCFVECVYEQGDVVEPQMLRSVGQEPML